MYRFAFILLFAITTIALNSFAQVDQISTGCNHVVVRMTDGSLWGWGDNSSGQLGLGHYNSQSKPVRIGNDSDWKWVSSGCSHTMAIKNNGSIWGWGGNYNGQLGTGNNLDRAIPTRLDKGFVWDEVYAGPEHTIAKKK
jgi:alpha-tubulin suppressor-like RCC1 family protein